MIIEKITSILESCTEELPKVRPTILYNEGWLLRLVLDWFSTHSAPNHPLSLSENARWFSEALLPSPFRPEHRGDSLGEAWTHADAVIGQFKIGDKGKNDGLYPKKRTVS